MFFSISAGFVGFPIQQYLDGGLKHFCFFCYLVNLSQFDLRIFFLNGLKSPTRSPSYFPLHGMNIATPRSFTGCTLDAFILGASAEVSWLTARKAGHSP